MIISLSSLLQTLIITSNNFRKYHNTFTIHRQFKTPFFAATVERNIYVNDSATAVNRADRSVTLIFYDPSKYLRKF